MPLAVLPSAGSILLQQRQREGHEREGGLADNVAPELAGHPVRPSSILNCTSLEPERHDHRRG